MEDDNCFALQWPLVQASYVYSGPGIFVRVVKIKTENEEYNRAVRIVMKLTSKLNREINVSEKLFDFPIEKIDIQDVMIYLIRLNQRRW